MSYDYLFEAIYDNKFDVLKELLNEEIAVKARNSQGFTLLHAAIHVNRLDILDYLLSTYSIPVNSRCHEGRTAFFYACDTEIQDYNIIKTLINHGSDINLPNKEGITPFHISCRNGNTALTKLLIGNNVSGTTNLQNGYTPLHYIALSNCVNTFNLLMNYENYDFTNDLNKLDFDSSTALMLAVDVANFEIAKELIQIGADCNVIGRETTALHLAVITQQPEIFELLWERTNFEIILELNQQNNLVKLLIQFGWFFPDRSPIFFRVLDHPNILQILGCEIKIFTVFFYRIRFVKYIQDIDIIQIVKKFLEIGVKPTQNDLRIFILNFYRFTNSFDILHLLIRNGDTNLDDENIIKFVIELYPKLVPKFLPFCVKNGPLKIITYFTKILRINPDMIKLIILMLYYCTPNYTLKQSLKDHLTNFCFAIINVGEGSDELLVLYEYIMNCLKTQKVPSLSELSRDVYRNSLGENCENSGDFLKVISQLELPKDIINILQCTMPVNVLLDL